jgi:hypothetical protein
MSDKEVPQIIGSADARRTEAGGEIPATARPLRFLGSLTFVVLAVGLISLLSYSLTASDLIRSDNPALAAWWEAHQFYFMEGGATAFGLLLGIRITGSLVARPDQRYRAGWAALVFAIVAFAPLIHVCAAAARLGWNGRGASFASWLISREGYEPGRQIDKVMIAGVYFLKTAGYALLTGLGLMAIAYAAVVALEAANVEIDKA